MKDLFPIPDYITISRRGINFVENIETSGISSGIKEDGKKDLALIFSKTPAVASAVFTKNKLKGAHIEICKRNIKNPDNIRAIIINSGNANTATGRKGIQDAEKVIRSLSQSLSISEKQVLIASTGIIGVPLPTGKIINAIPELIGELSRSGRKDAAEAILTTDKFIKEFACEVRLSMGKIKIGAIGKGAGMIAPDLATMLCFVVTSLKSTKAQINDVLKNTVKSSFNCISVDGDMSPNDTVILMANGSSNISIQNKEDLKRFERAIEITLQNIAFKIVKDGEGAKKVIIINVSGAKSERDAFIIAKSVGESNLVKTAISGEDANWGRILNSVGNSGANFSFNGFKLFLGDTKVADGICGVKFDEGKVKKIMGKDVVDINLKFSDGSGKSVFWASDLTEDYVKINSKYRT